MTPLQIFASCLMMAAQTYEVPPQIMVGILHVEGGKVGQEVGPNVNGTYDLGPMQVNSRWLNQLSGVWHVDQKTARRWVRDNSCVNLHVSAWILRQKIEEANGNLFYGIARYHSATPQFGYAYAAKVIHAMEAHGLIDYGNGSGQAVANAPAPAHGKKGKTIRIAER